MKATVEENKNIDTESADISMKKRRKLWEVNKRYHCSIIGTCLTIKDLKKIAHKAEIEIKMELSIQGPPGYTQDSGRFGFFLHN